MLITENLRVSYGTFEILKGISFTLKKGSLLMVIGPNGAGKSTMLNAISQNILYSGNISYCGENLKQLKPKQRARITGLLSQNHNVGYSFSVEEVVRMGRYAYSTGLFTQNGQDMKSIKQVLEITGMTELKDKSVLTLSGGELQRTFLAQLIAQDPEVMLLDEPANHLDIMYQKQVFELIKKWVKETGKTAIGVVHDLSLAKKYGTHALLMDNGEIAAYGGVQEVLTRDNLKKTYGIDVYEWMNDMLGQWRQSNA